MNPVNNRLGTTTKTVNNQGSLVCLKKVEAIKTKRTYEKFLNWEAGEFDLYLMNESEILKVYFPNGSFSIKHCRNRKNKEFVEIRVEGKSSVSCQTIMNKLERVYLHLIRFTEINSMYKSH